MDYLFLGGDLLTRGGGGFGPTIPIDPQPVTSGSGTTATTTTSTFNRGTLGSGGGLRLYGKIGDDMHVYLKALQENEDFTVLARPSIFTANNQKGIISSGERIAIPTNSNSYYQGGGSTQIQYQDVVLRLEVIPLINSEHEITLQISLLSDEVNGSQIIAGAGANGDPLEVPRITTREVLTTVTIPNNETIVLGGLITARTGEGVSGIPILSDIPYLGKLFSTTETKKERAELLVFIQPSIVNNRSSLDYVQSDADSRYKLSPNTRRFADGGEVLPPVEPTAPVSDKAAQPAKATRPPAASKTPSGGTMKKSIRPSQVR
jgi:type II secretory pathway component GspD/PulD (secretin)